jgi:hypothetical protein
LATIAGQRGPRDLAGRGGAAAFLQDFAETGGAPVAHRDSLAVARAVGERAAARALECRAGGLVGAQVQAIAGDQCDEQVVDIEAVAAEHSARPGGAQRCQQFHAMRDERRGLGHAGQFRPRSRWAVRCRP